MYYMDAAHTNILGKKIVTVGGGTGGFVLNRALMQYPVERTAISTVFDSGGSTGRLRDAHGILPSGDMRRLLVALTDDRRGRGESLRKLFSYRFPAKDGSELSDHSLGNLLLAAAEDLWGRTEAVQRIGELLNTRGVVYPISVDDAHITATLSDGTKIHGEGRIDTRDPFDDRTIVNIALEPTACILRDAAEALVAADMIVLGPGDHYTSIAPNVLVRGFADAIEQSNATLVYVVNIMTKAAETASFSAAAFVEDILRLGVGRAHFDAVLINETRPPKDLLDVYAEKERAEFVKCKEEDVQQLRSLTSDLIMADLLKIADLDQGLIRHDGNKLVHTLLSLL